MSTEHGLPYGEVDPKRSFDKVPVQIDWHDYLIRRRQPGVAVAADTRIRPERALATGVQYRCTTAGVTSRVPWHRIPWPTVIGQTITDGSVVWTAEAMSAASLRDTISTQSWPTVDGVTLSDESNDDLVYTVFVAGGSDEQDYEIKHRITLAGAPAETKEGVVVLPVRD